MPRWLGEYCFHRRRDLDSPRSRNRVAGLKDSANQPREWSTLCSQGRYPCEQWRAQPDSYLKQTSCSSLFKNVRQRVLEKEKGRQGSAFSCTLRVSTAGKYGKRTSMKFILNDDGTFSAGFDRSIDSRCLGQSCTVQLDESEWIGDVKIFNRAADRAGREAEVSVSWKYLEHHHHWWRHPSHVQGIDLSQEHGDGFRNPRCRRLNHEIYWRETSPSAMNLRHSWEVIEDDRVDQSTEKGKDFNRVCAEWWWSSLSRYAKRNQNKEKQMSKPQHRRFLPFRSIDPKVLSCSSWSSTVQFRPPS